MGAVLNVQLDRLDGMVSAMRAEKKTILRARLTRQSRAAAVAADSPDHDCATQVMYTLPSAEAATAFRRALPSVIAGKTGRHTYTEWDQVLMGMGAAHPAMNPYTMPANAGCRKSYTKDMCHARSTSWTAP